MSKANEVMSKGNDRHLLHCYIVLPVSQWLFGGISDILIQTSSQPSKAPRPHNRATGNCVNGSWEITPMRNTQTGQVLVSLFASCGLEGSSVLTDVSDAKCGLLVQSPNPPRLHPDLNPGLVL